MNVQEVSKVLMTKKYISEKNNALPDWFKKEYAHFDKIVSDANFPCHFGTVAHQNGNLLFTYVENHDFSLLPNKLTKFLKISIDNPENKHVLVVFIEPEETEKTFEYYHEYFWNILDFLHKSDEMEWPKEWPRNPDDPKWEFIYNKEPIFVSANGPFYKKRVTRNLGNSLILIFQPRRIFHDIAHDSPAGKKAIHIIRKKVEEIEQMPIHPDLGGYGDINKREWKQYLITDDNESTTLECPFKAKYFTEKSNRDS